MWSFTPVIVQLATSLPSRLGHPTLIVFGEGNDPVVNLPYSTACDLNVFCRDAFGFVSAQEGGE